MKKTALATEPIYRWNRLHPEKEVPLNVIAVEGVLAEAPPHSHDFEELFLVVGGTACYSSPSGKSQLEPGDVYLVHPGQEHGFSNSKHLSVYNVLWSPDELRFDFGCVRRLPGYRALFQRTDDPAGQGGSRQHVRLDREQLEKAKFLIEQIHEELNSHQEGYRTAIYSLLDVLFITICRKPADPEQASHAGPQNIARVIRYMEKHYAKPLGRANLAHIANMSGATFFRHFRKATGSSPMDYLQTIRLNQAEGLLRTTSLPLPDISTRCGFCDCNYFITYFRKRYNITPLRYRKLFVSADQPNRLQDLPSGFPRRTRSATADTGVLPPS